MARAVRGASTPERCARCSVQASGCCPAYCALCQYRSRRGRQQGTGLHALERAPHHVRSIISVSQEFNLEPPRRRGPQHRAPATLCIRRRRSLGPLERAYGPRAAADGGGSRRRARTAGRGTGLRTLPSQARAVLTGRLAMGTPALGQPAHGRGGRCMHMSCASGIIRGAWAGHMAAIATARGRGCRRSKEPPALGPGGPARTAVWRARKLTSRAPAPCGTASCGGQSRPPRGPGCCCVSPQRARLQAQAHRPPGSPQRRCLALVASRCQPLGRPPAASAPALCACRRGRPRRAQGRAQQPGG